LNEYDKDLNEYSESPAVSESGEETDCINSIEITDITGNTTDNVKAETCSEGKSTFKTIKTLAFGAVGGFLLCITVLMLCRGYYTIQIPGVGLLTVKLPTFGVFHNSDTSVDMAEFERKSEEIEYYLNEEYLYGPKKDEATDDSIRGLYYGLTGEDDYAEFYTAKEYEELMSDMEGSFVGIGVSVIKDEDTGAVKVLKTMKGGSAIEGGIKSGDLIIEADGRDLTAMDLETAVSYIKGEEGTSVKITVLRDGEKLEFELERRTVATNSVSYSLFGQEGEKIGYIYVSQFLRTTLGGFKDAVDELTENGAKGFVIDMRENPGGDMNICLSMLDYLLKDNDTRYNANVSDADQKDRTLLLSIETTKEPQQYFAEDGHECSIPVVVVVDDNSASASEIFSGVMKAYGSKVVGTATYGKGIVQSLVMLYDMSGIKFTSGEYVLPDGYHVHKVGVIPDVIIEATDEMKEKGIDVDAPDPSLDVQLAEAVKILKEAF